MNFVPSCEEVAESDSKPASTNLRRCHYASGKPRARRAQRHIKKWLNVSLQYTWRHHPANSSSLPLEAIEKTEDDVLHSGSRRPMRWTAAPCFSTRPTPPIPLSAQTANLSTNSPSWPDKGNAPGRR